MPDLTYRENRVRVSDFGRVRLDSPLLVAVPSVPGKTCQVHVGIADDLRRMLADFKAETGLDLLVTSGVRAHRWASRHAYEDFLVAEYSIRPDGTRRTRDEAIAEGRKWIAFDSPHETALVVDFGSCGLEPNRRTVKKQRSTVAWKWLRDNAHRYGFSPYLPEPWHWEHKVTLLAWQTGTAATEGAA
jgi:LAS superfamily LD-carboxypeptidase LdcB